MKNKINYILTITIFAIILSTSAFSQEVNSAAPDFAVKDLNGNTITLSELKGKVILLDFWASWCVPCKKSMPHLIELYSNKRADSLIVIGINVDTDLDT